MTAPEATALMVDWYVSERVDDADLPCNGDMLLFQWGTYDWGNGPSFQFDVTRQFISVTAEDDDDIWQLSLTLHFSPSDEARAMGAGDRWCGHPDDAVAFKSYIESTEAAAFAGGRAADGVEVEYFEAG